MLHDLVELGCLSPEGCIIAEPVGQQQISCNIKAVTDMLCMVGITSDRNDFSACILVHFQDVRMRVWEGQPTVQTSGIDLDSLTAGYQNLK